MIDNSKYIRNLKSIIKEKLYPLIDNDYVLWDLPYHKNIGDTFIWEGEKELLDSTGFKQLNFGSSDTADLVHYDESVIICLHGGGNFGDIYRSSQVFRNRVITKYKNNKIIIFPQSIHYDSYDILTLDASIINQHPNLYICLRDSYSYNLAGKHFVNANLLLVPDMAFYICSSQYEKYLSIGKGSLLLKRTDTELATFNYKQLIENVGICDVLDWPTFNKSYFKDYSFFIVSKLIGKCRNKHIHRLICKAVNNYAFHNNREYLLHLGYSFISIYDSVYTTRLHAFIIAFLLNKQVYLLDNKHRKLNNFYDTWLKNSNSVESIINNKE